ncbi:MAG: cell division protein SepF [Candidatus Woesearchaeota archaeon]|nr:MAG: cell division protein SepF [Candidatus Woesearchaeota archaeon]
MAGWFNKIKDTISTPKEEVLGDEYVEVEPTDDTISAKVLVRPFTLSSFADIKGILDAIREGRTIALINIAPLKEQDTVELKRAIDKLKKTIKANEGDIAGIGESWLIATPSFAKVYRKKEGPEPSPEVSEEEEIPKEEEV